jgi:hypothetical protein
MRRTLTLILGVALFGILAAVVVASQGADDPASTTNTTETVDRTTTTEDNPARARDDDNDAAEREDISGPCDEAEHATTRAAPVGRAPRPRAMTTTAPMTTAVVSPTRVPGGSGSSDDSGKLDDD